MIQIHQSRVKRSSEPRRRFEALGLRLVTGETLQRTERSREIVLDASIPQHFATLRRPERLEPIVLELAGQDVLLFRQLLGLTRHEVFGESHEARIRKRFERILGDVGLEFRAA